LLAQSLIKRYSNLADVHILLLLRLRQVYTENLINNREIPYGGKCV
jgi:hypothetical protein